MREILKSALAKAALLATGMFMALFTPQTDAFAQSADKKGLPGVQGDFRIARPEAGIPEAEPENPPRRDGTFRVGDWDVKVSGSITVDIGTFRPRSDR